MKNRILIILGFLALLFESLSVQSVWGQGIVVVGTQSYDHGYTIRPADLDKAMSFTADGATVQSTSSPQTWTGLVSMNASGIFAVASPNTITLNSVVGTGGLTLTGNGILNANLSQYNGILTINDGTLRLSTSANQITGLAGGSAGTLDLGTSGNTFTLIDGTRSNSTTFGGAIIGTGSFFQSGTGTLTLSNTASVASTINMSLNAGTLAIDTSTNLGTGDLVFNGGAFQYGPTSGINNTTLSRTIQLAQTTGGTINVTNPNSGGGTNTLTLSGNISGSGNLTKTGNGILEFSGTATNTGQTIISGGTLAISGAGQFSSGSAFSIASGATLGLGNSAQEIGSLAGPGNVSLGSGTLTTGANNTDTTFSGIMSGTGNLIKAGTGTMILSGNNTYTGATTVSAGTLLVNGITVGSTTVNSGATLGGTGTVGDTTIVSGGTLAPGIRNGVYADSVDDLTINGNLTLNSGSTLSIRVNDYGESDQVKATGTVTFDPNALFEVDAIAGSYSTPLTYGQYLFSGTNTPVSIPVSVRTNAVIRQKFLELTWNSDTEFQIGRKVGYFAGKGLTPNQREVGAALDGAGSPQLWDILTRLSLASESGNDAAVRSAYDEISGDLKANSMMLGQWSTSRYGLAHLDMTPCGTSFSNSFWLEFIHQTTDWDSDGNSRDYGISRTGFVLGSEEKTNDDTKVGMLIGYSQPYLYRNGDKVSANDLQFGFYGGIKTNDIVETKLHIGFGHQKYDMNRYIRSPLLIGTGPVQRIHSDFSGDSMSMSLEFSTPYTSNLLSLRPVLAIDSDLNWQYRFGEEGDTGLEMSYGRGFWDRTFLRIGVASQIGSVGECSPFALTSRLYYGYQLMGDTAPEAGSSFAGEVNPYTMRIKGVDDGRSYVSAGLGFQWNYDKLGTLYGDYDLRATDQSTAHYATIGYRQRW